MKKHRLDSSRVRTAKTEQLQPYFCRTLFNRRGQQDELQERHFVRRRLQERHFVRRRRQEPCVNNTYVFPYLMVSYFCSSNYNRLLSVSYESPCSRSLSQRRSLSASCAYKLPGCFARATAGSGNSDENGPRCGIPANIVSIVSLHP